MTDAASSRGEGQRVSAGRRRFLSRAATGAAGVALAAPLSVVRSAHGAGSGDIRLGLIGCGGRGSGAARQALRADSNAKLVAVADAFRDRLELGLNALRSQQDVNDRVIVDPDHQFVGFDAYRDVIAADVDVVLLATPPHFRPLHLRACIDAGKHVFAEKPVAVDALGVNSVLESTELAQQKNLCIVSGLNTRYSFRVREMIERIHDGAVGEILALHTSRYGSGVWVRPRKEGMTEMEYQMRNWYYFTWLSGDFNVEQFVHQLDLMAWVMKDTYPDRCYSTGGRQARTGPDYGHIYDHFSSVYEYESDIRLFSTTRHQPGCSGERNTVVMGTKGVASFSRRGGGIQGENPWQPPRTRETDSHQLEHDAFFAALRDGRVINNGDYMARSTLMAIMARMSAYTGQSLTWQQALGSQLDLSPAGYGWDSEPPEAIVAVPGVTQFM